MENQKEYKCEKCMYSTSRKGDYTKHCNSKRHITGTSKTKPEGYNCEKCNFKTENKQNYETHYLNNHGNSKERKEKFKYYCDNCDFGTFAEKSYIVHKETKGHIKREERYISI